MTVGWVWWWEAALNNLAAWTVTYLLYSTILLGGVAFASRLRAVSAAVEASLWRWALVLGPAAASARIAIEHAGDPGIATGPDALAVAGTAGSYLIGGMALSTLLAAVLTGALGRVAIRERTRLSGRRPAPAGEERRMLEALAVRVGRPVPRLTVHDAIPGPVAIGRDEICLPARGFEDLDADVRRAMLAHELGHLARRDNRWGTLAHVLERVFFLQPLHRVARRRHRECAEFMADAFAVRLVGRPEPLVAGLAALARGATPRLAHAFSPGSLLVRRVERVLGERDPERGAPVWLFAGLAAGLVALAWLSPAVVPAYDCRVTGTLPDVASWFLLHG